jgi:hypothetical protein
MMAAAIIVAVGSLANRKNEGASEELVKMFSRYLKTAKEALGEDFEAFRAGKKGV